MPNLTKYSLFIAPLLLLKPNNANACQCISNTGILRSLPADGAVDVPTDVSIWVAANDVRLVDANGETVATTQVRGDLTLFKTCSAVSEVIPDEPLEPLSEYTLIPALAPHPGSGAPSITFTTGAGPLSAMLPAAPETDIVFFDASNYENSCVDFAKQACVKSSASELFEVTIQYADNTERFVAPFDIVENMQLSHDQGCVEIRARDASGRVSEPAIHCFDASSFPVLLDSETNGTFIDCASDEIQALFGDNKHVGTSDESEDNNVATTDQLTDQDDNDETRSNSAPLKGIDESNPGSAAVTCSVDALGRRSLSGASWLLGLSLLALRQRRTRTGL